MGTRLKVLVAVVVVGVCVVLATLSGATTVVQVKDHDADNDDEDSPETEGKRGTVAVPKSQRSKIQITLTEPEAADLEFLMSELQIAKATDVVDLALDILYWAVVSKVKGLDITTYNPGDGTLGTLTDRTLDRVRSKDNSGEA